MNTNKIQSQKKLKNDKLVSANTQKKSMKRKTKLQLMVLIMSSVFVALEKISPKIAGWWAMRLWISTHRFAEPARETKWLESATTSDLEHKYGPIKIYQWPNEQQNAPRVLLIHGWNGRGLQLGAFVKPLLLHGYQVISFDAPGHGRSPGNESNMLRIADVVNSIASEIGSIDTIIGHSFGAMVMAKVISDGLKVRKAVAISSPLNANYLLEGFCSVLKITGKSKQNLLVRIDNRFGDDIFSRISAANNFKNSSTPGLIVHDINDKEIPVKHAKELNKIWSNSEIEITQKLGHLRILHNKKVINTIVNFLNSFST